MSTRDALSVFGDIDDRYVREAETAKARRWPHLLTVAACAALVAMTLGFAVEHWMMPSIVAQGQTHLCVEEFEPTDKDLGLYRRIVVRLQYQGRWYGVYDTTELKTPVCGEPLGEIYRAVDCPYCSGNTKGLHDLSGELFTVSGMNREFMLLLRTPNGQHMLFIAEDYPVFDSGEALFGEQFAVQARTYAVRAQTYWEALDWEYPRLTIPAEDPATVQFLEALNNALPTDDPEIHARPSWYVTLYLDNGVSMRLTLTDGGYVEWRGKAFRIDKDIYDAFTARLADE